MHITSIEADSIATYASWPVNPINPECFSSCRPYAALYLMHRKYAHRKKAAIAALGTSPVCPRCVTSNMMRRKAGLEATDIGDIEWPLPRRRLQRRIRSTATARKCCASNSRTCVRPLRPHCVNSPITEFCRRSECPE